MEIEDFSSVKYWLESMAGRAEGTKRSYVSHLKLFCEWVGKTPDELVKEREGQLKSEEKKVQRSMEMQVKRYNAYLDEKGAGAGTKTTARAAIKSFFEHHYMPLKFIRGDFPTEVKEERRKVEKEEILTMLDYADVRDRALLHVLKDSGLSVSDASRLKLGHLFPKSKIGPITAEDIRRLPDFIALNMVRRKTKAKIRSFLGREAIQALKTYFEYRMRGTAHLYYHMEKVGEKGMAPETLTVDSPLFRTHSRKVKAMSTKRIKDAVREIAKRSGIRDISAHSFRKYTQTMLESARLDPNWRRLILGRKLPGSEGSYSMPSTEDLMKAYKEAYKHIEVTRAPMDEKQLRIQSIVDQAKMLGVPQERIDIILNQLRFRLGETFAPEDLLEELTKERKRRPYEVELDEEQDPVDCQRICEESELEGFLAKGWRVQAVLPSGRIVILNERS